MMDIVKKAIFASVGAVLLTEEKVRDIVDDLISKGEVSEKEGEGLFNDLLKKIDDTRTNLEGRISQQVEKTLDSFNVAHTKDIKALKRKIKKLEDEIDALKDVSQK